MKLYECKDGDRIDLIVLKYYGTLKYLNDVIGANNNLCKMPMILCSGTTINLPDFQNIQQIKINVTQQAKRVPLW